MIRPIAEFLALLAIAALAVHLFIPYELARILIYFVVALLIAILFPPWRRPLEKDVVDLLYYTAAMTFVALLFVTKSAERERLHLSEEMQVLEQRHHDIQAEAAAFGFVSAEIEPYREWIDQQIEAAYKRKEEAQRLVCACAELGRLRTSCGEGTRCYFAARTRHDRPDPHLPGIGTTSLHSTHTGAPATRAKARPPFADTRRDPCACPSAAREWHKADRFGRRFRGHAH